MFCGIIKHTGTIIEHEIGSLSSIVVQSELFSKEPPLIGASIAVDGVCLSVTHYDDKRKLCRFNLGEETLKLTLFVQQSVGHQVNLENAARFGQPIDGHFVQGHVDAVAKLVARTDRMSSILMRFSCPTNMDPLLIPKGSIAINGVSLTLNHVETGFFEVCLVPITAELTTLKTLLPGSLVHIETDILGRYLLKQQGLLPVTTESFVGSELC